MTKEDINSFSYRISQASGTDLIVIMLDMTKQYINDAMTEYEAGRIEEFEGYTKQAKRVTDALSSSLDMQYEISSELYSIYAYAGRTLNKALIKSDIKELPVLYRVMDKLSKTFAEAAKSDTAGPLMGNTQKVYAGLTYSNGRLNEVAYDLHGDNNRGFTV